MPKQKVLKGKCSKSRLKLYRAIKSKSILKIENIYKKSKVVIHVLANPYKMYSLIHTFFDAVSAEKPP